MVAKMDFKCALVTGGGGGIGKALAQDFISQGKKVIIAGRTEANLQKACKEIGAAGYYVLDTGVVSKIPDFVLRLTADHPDLDCLVNNAGVQRPLSVTDMTPEEFLEKADQEIDINQRGPMHLALHLLSHFRKKPHALIINVSSVLGYVPFSLVNPVYNGTKAWVHFWTMNLRAQLNGTNVKVVEIAPPTVATDLHRDREDPDDNKKSKNSSALSVDEFITEISKRLGDGDENIGAGMSVGILEGWDQSMGSLFRKLTK
ncbi:NAD(P)-binding protein [Xylaria cf. heliscus]|nr:NAD(P)-binding protein [Xylaria cf. heliscus]